ncbi:MAG TPA: hypothetical protein VN253_23280 [Kofleriaceae bacterium]|nr:hypothetical protein [Kofleriaceae bacterium]
MRILLVVAILGACAPAARDPVADAPLPPDPTADAAPAIDTSRVYAHSGTMLYRLNNLTLAATPVGPLTGLGTQNLLDLAIDKNDRLVGITRDTLYTIDATTGAATLVKNLDQTARGFTSLSYAPADFADPTSPDILISANDQGQVFQIDLTGAQATARQIGSYGTTAAGKIVSSGDLIAVRGFGIFATVDVGTGTEDYLARIDPKTWRATPLGIGTGFDKIFGLGYWNGRIYGFVDDGFAAGTGRIIDIDPNTGRGLLISSDSIRWFGAGVSTSAPIL